MRDIESYIGKLRSLQHGCDTATRPGLGFMAGTRPGPDITAEGRSGSREPSSARHE